MAVILVIVVLALLLVIVAYVFGYWLGSEQEREYQESKRRTIDGTVLRSLQASQAMEDLTREAFFAMAEQAYRYKAFGFGVDDQRSR